MVDEESEYDSGDEEELHTEGIMVVVVGCLEANVDQVQCSIRSSQEDHL